MTIILEVLVIMGCVSAAYAGRSIKRALKKRRRKKRANRYMKKSKASKSDPMCVICQEDFKMNKKQVQLHCNHKYHKKCIREWIGHKETCPLCNTHLQFVK